ncbi:hypothetical protein [Arthrobacter sp. A2-55]|uniref:hypothetical protein n=1 Tax=Arthrobacter sp. A2-55 TaxID=2897337 RepID=UPI0021CD1F8F|nr:hypothetical protein [Arthrobacter sp. A2-55]MCU6479043.1 hypothetical protein [Arthrobacter sp. A2-55]
MPSIDFWTGFITLPALLIVLAAVAAAFFGGWKVFESWADRRYTRLREVQMPSKHSFDKAGKFTTWTLPNLGGREAMAAITLTSKTVGLFRITGNCGIIFVRGQPGVSTEAATMLTAAIPRAVEELAKEADQNTAKDVGRC